MEFGKTDHKYEFGPKSEKTHCPRCMREKNEAINEQVQMGCCCDDPKCEYVKEIIEAIKIAKESKYCIICGNPVDIGDIYCINCGCKIYKP